MMLTFAAGALLRSTIILGTTLLVCRCLRRWSAASRHKLLLFAFVLLALEPVLSLCSPQLVFALTASQANVSAQQSFRIASSRRVATSPSMLRLYWPLLLYAGGVCLVGANLMRSWRKAALLSRQATLAHPDWIALVGALCDEYGLPQAPHIAMSGAEIMPFACGLRRAAIILPSACDSWPQNRKRTVLLHELAHLHRRDIPAQLLASLVVVLWWFQPLAWWAYRELRRESEAASDAFVVSAGIRASEYAEDLLAIAQEFGQSQLPIAAIGMAREHGLSTRVSQLLRTQQAKTLSRSLVLAILSSLTALTISVSAVTIDTHESSKGGMFMKRAIIAGLLAGAGVSSAANVSGTVYDESGAALTNAKVVISEPDSSFTQDLTTDASGRFAFASLPAGTYILRVQRPGFATLLREFHLDGSSDVERGLTLQMNTAQPDQTPLRVPGAMEQSNLTHKVNPVYPAAAKAAHITGTVKLEAMISKEGIPQDVRVLSSPNDDLSQSALDAVRQWRYQPLLLNGQPMEIVTEVIVTYSLAQ